MNAREAGIRPEGGARIGDPGERFAALGQQLREGLIGLESLVERLMVGLLSGGHILLEGAPGLAKTRAVKRLASGLDVSFSRIQCTPDLMPADLTGTSVWRPDQGIFEFVEGPVFHSLVLVDEINRAPPKVQSALLEAMAERQVTASGKTYPLPDPFMVVATQNPIEHEGTFPLPEAQVDRFLLHVFLDLPDARSERDILDLVERESRKAGADTGNRLSIADIHAARAAVANVHLSLAIKDYIVRLVMATRDATIVPDLRKLVEYPVSPRGTLALAQVARARAFLQGRDFAIPEDVIGYAADALAHRLGLTWRATADGETARRVIDRLVQSIAPL